MLMSRVLSRSEFALYLFIAFGVGFTSYSVMDAVFGHEIKVARNSKALELFGGGYTAVARDGTAVNGTIKTTSSGQNKRFFSSVYNDGVDVNVYCDKPPCLQGATQWKEGPNE